jgi:ribosomal protein L37AE/L43A
MTDDRLVLDVDVVENTRPEDVDDFEQYLKTAFHGAYDEITINTDTIAAASIQGHMIELASELQEKSDKHLEKADNAENPAYEAEQLAWSDALDHAANRVFQKSYVEKKSDDEEAFECPFCDSTDVDEDEESGKWACNECDATGRKTVVRSSFDVTSDDVVENDKI